MLRISDQDNLLLNNSFPLEGSTMVLNVILLRGLMLTWIRYDLRYSFWCFAPSSRLVSSTTF